MHTTTPEIDTRPYYSGVQLSRLLCTRKIRPGDKATVAKFYKYSMIPKCCVYISYYATVFVATLPACLQLKTFKLWHPTKL